MTVHTWNEADETSHAGVSDERAETGAATTSIGICQLRTCDAFTTVAIPYWSNLPARFPMYDQALSHYYRLSSSVPQM